MASRRRQNNPYSADDADYGQNEQVVVYKIGIYGWRKRCLYFLILLIFILAIINLALTVWILRVQDFNLSGIGKLKVTDNGIILEGPAEFIKTLKAKHIVTRQDSPLNVQSMRNVTITARNSSNKLTGQIHIGNDEVVMRSKRMRILDESGKSLLYADKDKFLVNVRGLEFDVTGGLKFDTSVQTPLVKAGDHQTLTLESLTKKMYMNAAEGININANAHDIKATSLQDMTLKSQNGQVVVNANSIVLKNLKTSDSSTTAQQAAQVREVCMCQDGTLFLAGVSGATRCQSDGTTCPLK